MLCSIKSWIYLKQSWCLCRPNEEYLCRNNSFSDAFNQSVPTLTAAYPGWNIVCEANTNSESCSYKWKEFKTDSDGDEDTKTVSNHSTMALNTPGRYRCEAKCSLRGHTCLIFPIAINVQLPEAVPFSDAFVGNLTQTTAVSTNAKSTKASYLAAILIISKHL